MHCDVVALLFGSKLLMKLDSTLPVVNFLHLGNSRTQRHHCLGHTLVLSETEFANH